MLTNKRTRMRWASDPGSLPQVKAHCTGREAKFYVKGTSDRKWRRCSQVPRWDLMTLTAEKTLPTQSGADWGHTPCSVLTSGSRGLSVCASHGGGGGRKMNRWWEKHIPSDSWEIAQRQREGVTVIVIKHNLKKEDESHKFWTYRSLQRIKRKMNEW